MEKASRSAVFLYRLLTGLAAPFVRIYLKFRLLRGKEDSARFSERLGHPSHKRPHGKLIWFHAASVGEAMSVLSLMAEIKRRRPDANILFTTGTVTSANMLEKRMPNGAVHQYAPVDRWPYVTRFLDHWKPDLAMWVESELWPNMLTCLGQRKIPAVLLNGRMSEKSFRQWSVIKGSAKKILEPFVLGFAQTEIEKNRFSHLGVSEMHCVGNLKYTAEPLPFDESALVAMKQDVGGRKIWLMASTHAGEDEIAMFVHEKLSAKWPPLLTIIVPRHPLRGDMIEKLAVSLGLVCTRRSRGEKIGPQTQIYLADTMGELGLFYRLSPACCVGGSFVWGGHNPVEPAQLGCAMVYGPRMTNFAEIAAELVSQGAAAQVQNQQQLADRLENMLAYPEEATMMADAAKAVAAQKHGILDEILRRVEPLLNMETQA